MDLVHYTSLTGCSRYPGEYFHSQEFINQNKFEYEISLLVLLSDVNNRPLTIKGQPQTKSSDFWTNIDAAVTPHPHLRQGTVFEAIGSS